MLEENIVVDFGEQRAIGIGRKHYGGLQNAENVLCLTWL